MPLKKCGDDGWKWGDSGKCYTGPDAKKKAIKQGIAIDGPKKFSEKASEDPISFSEEEIESISDYMYEKNYSLSAIVCTISSLVSSKLEKKIKEEMGNAQTFKYRNPKTGEIFEFNRQGVFKKDGVILIPIR